MACKQCELSRVKGVVVTKCGARNSCIPEVVQKVETIDVNFNEVNFFPANELLSEITDIDNEEAE